MDQPISAAELVLKRSASGKETLQFRSKDPAFLFPAIGSAADPVSGTPGGATIELFSQDGSEATLSIPAGAGKPGWTTKASPPISFKFMNSFAPGGISPVRNALLRQGKLLTLKANAIGLPLLGPQGTVGIRITTGTLRSCALFDAATIKRDTASVFVARNAIAANLSDCSDASFGGSTCGAGDSCCNGSFIGDQCGGTCPPGSACGTRDLDTCLCISSAQPCGDTSPVCNGECPVGEECLTGGGFPLPSCVCLPTGSTACSKFECGGACPTGQECNFFEISTPGASGCVCGPPGPCGSGGDDCPAGFHCAFGPGIGPLCLPD